MMVFAKLGVLFVFIYRLGEGKAPNDQNLPISADVRRGRTVSFTPQGNIGRSAK